MKVQRFEDLRCWQAARQLVRLVFIACRTGMLSQDPEMKYQIKKASLSSMNNIAEGFGRFGPKDSIKFYDISQASAQEVKSMTYVLTDLEYLRPDAIEAIRLKAQATRSLTLAFIKSIRNRLSEKTATKTLTDPKTQHINTSTHQHTNTPTHQHLNTPK